MYDSRCIFSSFVFTLDSLYREICNKKGARWFSWNIRSNGSKRVRAQETSTLLSATSWTSFWAKKDGNGRVTVRFTVRSRARESPACMWHAYVKSHMHSYECSRAVRSWLKEIAERLDGITPRDKAIVSALSGPNRANQPQTVLALLLRVPRISLPLSSARTRGPSLFRYLSWNTLPLPGYPLAFLKRTTGRNTTKGIRESMGQYIEGGKLLSFSSLLIISINTELYHFKINKEKKSKIKFSENSLSNSLNY